MDVYDGSSQWGFKFLISLFGSEGRWLTNPKIALYSLILVTVWKGVGYYTVIVVAALASIPKDLYEAAALDNASGWRTFTKIPFLRLLQRFILLSSLILLMRSKPLKRLIS